MPRPEIIKAFPDGILWATFGQNPDLKIELTAIFAALTDERPIFAGVDDAKRSVAEKLESRQCLLVVDDVWRDSHLEPLQEVGAARVLYTTRRRDLDTKAASVEVDEMSRDEAASLLARDLPLSQDLRPKLAEFAAELGNWPLLLALANARIRSELKQRGALENAFARVSEVYRRRGVTGFDSQHAEKREEAARLSVSAGLESFDDRFRKRATSIGLFPEDVPVPVQVLADLWTCGVFEAEEDVLQHLHNLRVVTWDGNANTVTVHEMIRAALASNVSDRASQHAKLLDAWGDRHRLPHAYAWRWVGYHLHGAGRQAELEALLLDLDWLRAKLDATEIDALVREFDYARDDPHLRALQEALRLSSHVLAKSKSQLPGQLLARLPESEGSLRQSILERASKTRGPWLRPLRPSLPAPGGPPVRNLEGHAGWVRAVALTPDGKRLVSGSDDRTLKVWDLESGRELRTLEGHAYSVTAVTLTPDGKRAVSGSFDHMLKVWDLESGRELRTLEGHAGKVRAVALTPDGKRAVSGSWDHSLKVWDLESGRELHTLEGHANLVTAVALTPDGKRAVSGSFDHTLKVWDLERGRELRTLDGHAAVKAVALTPDGKRAVSASADRTIVVWELETGTLVATFRADSEVRACAAARDGVTLVAGDAQGCLHFLRLENASQPGA